MKKITLLIAVSYQLLVICQKAEGQIITTIAGRYALGASYSGDGGPATAAGFNYPAGLGFDGTGNLYVGDQNNNVIRQVNTSGIISTVTGNYSFGAGYSGNGGAAIIAELNGPNEVGFDVSGNLYIADWSNNVIRKVNTSGIISTIAGNHSIGYNGDGGPATAAELFTPSDVVLDASGNLYIADRSNSVIRKVNTSGIISTFAGQWGGGYSGDGGPATAAELYFPYQIALDASGNLFIADFQNNVIRKVNTFATICTVAGNGFNHGAGFGGYTGDGGPATAAELNNPSGVALDASGNLYIADFENNVIRKVNSYGTITTIAGIYIGVNGGYSGDGGLATAAELDYPFKLTFDLAGNLYIDDLGNEVIRRMSGLVPCALSQGNPIINQQITCYGNSNGSVTAVISSGGTPPYIYQWNAGYTSTNATNSTLSAGTYTITITDNTGCTATADVSISQPPLLQDSINSSCATCCNCKGTTHVYVWGGISPYTYSWSNGRTNDTMISLSGGMYTVTVWDSAGCMLTDSVFVTYGDHVSASQTNVGCNGASTGSATVVTGSGFTYSWSPGGATTASISGLSAGVYNVTTTNIDTLTCTDVYSFTITQPPALIFNYYFFGLGGSICEDTVCQIVAFEPSGGTPPYTYYGLFPCCGPVCITSTVSGTVVDANGCSASIAGGSQIPFGPSIRVQINNNASCNGGSNGSATVNLNTGTVGTLLLYSWSPGGGTNQTQTNLSAGTYTISVSQSIGLACPVSAVIAITQPPALILTADTINASPGNCDGSAWANVSGGVAPYTYSWTGGLATDTITNQCAGYYCCTITDASGCIDSVCTNIETSTGTSELTMDNGQLTIYPNPNDGQFTVTCHFPKGSLRTERSEESPPIMEIYNVLGQNVSTETLRFTQGDNTIDLSSQADGVYFYRVLYEDGELIGEGKLVIEK